MSSMTVSVTDLKSCQNTRDDMKNWSASFLIFILIFFVDVSLVGQAVADKSFDKRLKELLTFDIPQIDVKEAHTKFGAVIFLDAREEEEYNVSHIPNAIHIGYKKFDEEAVVHLPKDSSLVVYCSVGYRSEKIGNRLEEMGFTNVRNLYGSIFEWVNNGYEVVDKSGPVRKVHTYNKKWSRWVKNADVKKVL